MLHMKTISLLVLCCSLLAVLGWVLLSKHTPHETLTSDRIPTPIAASNNDATLSSSEQLAAPRVPSEIIPEASQDSSEPAPLSGLAPDGQPYRTTQEIGEEKKLSLKVEWVGNTKRLIYEGGQVYAETPYKEGKKDGPSQSWYDNGQLNDKGGWASGKREGQWTTYARNGALLATGGYKSNYRDGYWEEWFPSGRRKSVGSYQSPQGSYPQSKTGQWSVWHDDGSLDETQSGTYENGKLIPR